MKLLILLFAKLHRILDRCNDKYMDQKYKQEMNIHPLVVTGKATINGNVSIKEGTYLSTGHVVTGHNSKIEIGEYCAIGFNVQIRAITHDTRNPTGATYARIEKNIKIGNYVWIGSNVYIREGITIGDHSIIGANSVVTKNVPANVIAAGVPAKIIKRLRKSDYFK